MGYVGLPLGVLQARSGFHVIGIDESIEKIDKVQLLIFNRWGVILFEDPDYKNDWEGTDKRNKELPDGTYYYLVNLNDDSKLSGFVIIKR